MLVGCLRTPQGVLQSACLTPSPPKAHPVAQAACLCGHCTLACWLEHMGCPWSASTAILLRALPFSCMHCTRTPTCRPSVDLCSRGLRDLDIALMHCWCTTLASTAILLHALHMHTDLQALRRFVISGAEGPGHCTDALLVYYSCMHCHSLACTAHAHRPAGPL